MKYRFLITLMISSCICGVLFAEVDVANFPLFSFEGHDGTLINNKTIRDLEIKIIIYGTPDALSNNRKQLDLVLDWLKSTKKTNLLLYTVNFSSYPKMIRGIIKNQMKKNSKELGIIIYADWTGIFKQHFQLENSQVHLFLLLENNNENHYECFSFSNAEKALSKLKELTW